MKSTTVEAVIMKHCLLWTLMDLSHAMPSSEIHCENVTQFICSIYANAHPDSCKERSAWSMSEKVKLNLKMQISHLLSWILGLRVLLQTTCKLSEPRHTSMQVSNDKKGFTTIMPDKIDWRTLSAVIWYTFHMK